MEERYFYKEVNKQSRKEMAFFINNHFTYDRSNSWSNWKGYANNVKIYNLGLTREQELKVYETLLNYEVDASEFWDSVTDIDIIDYEDLKTMSKKELQKVTEVLQKFGDFCDALRSDLIYYLDNATIEEIEETIINTRTVLTI